MSTYDLRNDASASSTINNDTMTRAMALNLADWHTASIRPYGVESVYTDSLWWRLPGGSGIYLGAIILDPQTPDAEICAELTALEDRWGSQGFWLYDCWGARDLSSIGFTRQVKNPWHLRTPAAAPALDLPEGLSIEIVNTAQQLADFERASWEGFEEPENPEEALQGRESFSQHPVATLNHPRMYYLNARLEGEVMAGVIIHATEDMMGVYGISTLIPFRRRGYARALIRAALALRPDLPMSVFPDPVSVPIYTDVGFVAAGEIAIWKSTMAS